MMNAAVYKVSAAGILTTVVGNGYGYSGDGGPASKAQVSRPNGLALDAAGNLFIADSADHRIRRVAPNGIITTIAGTGIGGHSGDGGPALKAQLQSPNGIAVDSLGNLYISDFSNHRIRRVSPAGVIVTVAGTGTEGYAGDGGPAASARIGYPRGVAVDAFGNIYFSDTGSDRVRRVNPSGLILAFAGGGVSAGVGDGLAATSARLYWPHGVAVDGQGNVFIADRLHLRIRKVAANALISTAAGVGKSVAAGDGGPATAAQLLSPRAVALDRTGNLYIADTTSDRIRKVSPAGVISSVAGGGTSAGAPDGSPATSIQLAAPGGVTVDQAGNVYLADSQSHRVRRVTPAGVSNTVAGTGLAGASGDGGPGTAARLFYPHGLAVDSTGNLYIADTMNHRIRRLSPEGVITTVAGTGVGGYTGDGDAATRAQLNSPYGVAFDGTGSLYIADTGNHAIRKVSPAGTITTVAGTGQPGFAGEGEPAVRARLYGPYGVAVDAPGNIYVADAWNMRIRRISPDGNIATIAGAGTLGYSGDGGSARNAEIGYPFGVVVDPEGRVYVADNYGHAVRLLRPAAPPPLIVNTGETLPAGTVGGAYEQTLRAEGGVPPFTWAIADGTLPAGLTLSPAGVVGGTPSSAGTFRFTVRVRDFAGSTAVRAITLTIVNTSRLTMNGPQVLAAATAGVDYSASFTATGGSPPYRWSLEASTAAPGLALSSAGVLSGRPTAAGSYTLFVEVRDSASAVVTRGFGLLVRGQPSPVIRAVAGTGSPGYSGDGGSATAAALNRPTGMAVDSAGNLYIADQINNRVRKVAAGVITTVAGTGTAGFTGDGGPATTASLRAPAGVAVDAAGNLFIADTGNQRIRKVTAGGIISTIAGTGSPGFAGDGGPAVNARLNSPWGLALDGAGNLYFSDLENRRVRKIEGGIVTTVAGNGIQGYNGDYGRATAAQLDRPEGIALDLEGNLYIADGNRVRKVSQGGISTVAGGVEQGSHGDNEAATAARLSGAADVAVDASGTLYIADHANFRVRRVSRGLITTLVGSSLPSNGGDNGPASQAGLGWVGGVAVSAAGDVYVADWSYHRVRRVQMSAVAPLAIVTPPALPHSTTGTPYAQPFGATGGTLPYTWTLAAGTLPAGLTLTQLGMLNG
ncbi:MAG TPA: hypothetical protein DEH78_21710, partial [Solibacterales bacterium]|nr:hypothetical protein [Bryobacterales bacterium]